MAVRYGLPYKGSKNAIAKQIIEQLPPAENFYDIFAGGCAITHAAIESGKYKNFYVNDIKSGLPQLFFDVVTGKHSEWYTRWISREEFNALKDVNHLVALCWSFGNDGKAYLYSVEREPFKKAFHEAAVYNNYTEFAAMGIFPPRATETNYYDRKITIGRWLKKNEPAVKAAYIEWYKATFFGGLTSKVELICEDIKAEETRLRAYLKRHLILSGLRISDVDKFLGTNGMAQHYFNTLQWEFPTVEAYEKLDEIMNWSEGYPISYKLAKKLQRLESLESLERLQSLQRLERLESLESLERLQSRVDKLLDRIHITKCDYREIEVKPNSVIYCDPPYKGTSDYGTNFDHDAFYDWCEQQTEICVISEYEMP